MQLLVQAILSVSGESKKPELQDCLALRDGWPISPEDSTPDTSYMVEYSQQYQTDETYSRALPHTKESKCCSG